MSSNHIKLYYDYTRSKWVLEDLCSMNGTIVVRGYDKYIVYEGHRDNPRPNKSTCGSIYLECNDNIGVGYSLNDNNIHAVDMVMRC